jgi:Ca2+-binding RTX toxin-like protein
MPQSELGNWLQFALQQIAAESYLNNIDITNPAEVTRLLLLGNNQEGFPETSPTRFTGTLLQGQANDFAQRYQIIDHHANDATGFSATVIFDRQTQAYTLSMRSSEYRSDANGGDRSRDIFGADAEIAAKGFAFAQLVSMERYFADLKQGRKSDGTTDQTLAEFFGNNQKQLNVTGYSLSGHLATVFTELHNELVLHTYTFNGAGRGAFAVPGTEVQEVAKISAMLSELDARLRAVDPDGNLFRSGAVGNIYQDARYADALAATRTLFPTTGTSEMGPGATGGISRSVGAFEKTTQVFGHAVTGVDLETVANSGIHAPAQQVLIEGQPLFEGFDSHFELQYGNTHSITLIVDSLALQDLLLTIDPTLTQTKIENIFKAVSDQTADTTVLPGSTPLAEGNTLEKTLDGLRRVFLGTVPDTLFGRQPGDFGNLAFRNSFYQHIQEVTTALTDAVYRIDSLVGQSAGTITTIAQQDGATDALGIAYRYALKELNPFVVRGIDHETTQALYAPHNETGELSLADPDTGLGELTPQYLADRAAFLAKKIEVNSSIVTWPASAHFKDNALQEEIGSATLPLTQILFGNGTNDMLAGSLFKADHLYGGSGDDHVLGQGGNDYLEGNRGDDILDGGSGADTLVGGQGNDTYIIDNAGDTVVEYANGGIDTVQSSVTFTLDAQVETLTLTGASTISGIGNELANTLTGNEAGNVLKGLGGDDHLIGNGGNDVLVGGQGSDLLEGGTGFDTYMYRTGDGLDRIEDSDAKGEIIFNGQRLLGGIHKTGDAADTYTSLDGSFTYVIANTDLLVNGVLTVNQNFQNGQMGIELRDAAEANYDNGLPTNTFTGTAGDDTIVTGGVAGTRNALVHAGAGNDSVLASANNDQLFGEAGQDQLFGNSGDDRLYGEAGNDVLIGDNAGILTEPDGNDMVDGGDGADTLVGGFGHDVLYGGDGNDVLFGDYDAVYAGKVSGTLSLDDVLDGGAGDDELHGGDGNDVLYGGAGSDFLSGEEGNDFEGGGAGNDLLLAYLGDDTLAGGAGIDTLFGDQGHDVLDGGDDADTLHGGDGADELYGGTGDDLLFGDGLNNPSQLSTAGGADFLDGDDGDDHLEAGAGDDTLFGGAGADALFGEEGADSLFGDAGDDELQGGNDNDLLGGDAGNDRLFGQDGADTLYGDDGDDALAGNEGNDTLAGGIGADVLEGGHGDDVVEGGEGDDTYIFNLGDGRDTIADNANVDQGNTIQFGAGITVHDLVFTPNEAQQTLVIQVTPSDSITLLGFDPNTFQYGVRTLAFADGSRTALADVLPLPSGSVEGDGVSNVISTGSGDDTIDAGAGDDLVNAGGGNDTLIGGPGNDALNGGPGNDTYVFSSGDGADTINDTASAGEGNRLIFAGSTTPDSVKLGVRSDGGLQIETGTLGDSIVLPLFSRLNALGAHAVEQFQFADGTTWSYAQLLGLGFDFDGTEHDDFLSGTSVNDRIAAREGADSIQGNEGDDTIDAGAGDDFVNAGTGNNTVFGGDGNDTIQGGSGNDRLFGNAGDDTIFGQGGSDVIDAGPGNDQFIGSRGSYTYVFGAGGGHDNIRTGSGGSYLIQMSAGVRPSDVEVARRAQGLTLSLFDGAATLAVPEFYQNPSFEVHFADGTAWNATMLHNRAGSTQIGTEGDDFLTGFRGFTDELIGLGGNDVYIVNDATDSVVEQPDGGHDLVVSGVDYTLSGTLEDLSLSGAKFGAGNALDNVLTGDASSNVLSGEAGNDVLDGGRLDYSFSPTVTLNDDTLIGGAGSDTYLYDGNLGGIDTIVDQSSNGDTNTLRVSASSFFASADPLQWFHLRLDGTALAMVMDFETNSVLEHTREVRFPDFDPNDAYGRHAIDILDFRDGMTTLTYQQLIDLGIDVYGTSQSETVQGTTAPNRFHGGAGNDTLVGGPRNDIYFFDQGDGADTIVDPALPGAMNEIRFGKGISVGDLEPTAGLNALTIHVGDNGDAMTVSDYDPTGRNGSSVIGTLTFADGFHIGLDEWLNLPGGTEENDTFIGTNGPDRYHARGGDDVVLGSDGNDLLLGGSGQDELNGAAGDDKLFGGSGNDKMDGGAGDDELEGGAGSDTLTGGTGNDTLNGGLGADTYVFNIGDGQDVIHDTSNVGGDNRLLFGPGITISDLEFSVAYGGQFGVPINGANLIIDRIYVGGFGQQYIELPNIQDTPPALRTVSFADGLTLDIFDYYAASQIRTDQDLQADDGNATLIGGSGNNTLRGGSGNNALIGGRGINTMIGGSGRSTFYSQSAANNTVFFGTGSNILIIPAGASRNTVHALGAPESNRVVFGGGYNAFHPNLTFGSLLIRYGSQGGELHIEGFNPDDAYANPGIGTFEFTDRILTYDQLIDLGFDIRGTDGADVLTGSSATDRMKGLAGDDTLEAGLGADELEGGQGDDFLRGGAGNDIYIFNVGDGIDAIDDVATAGEGNRIQFGTGITQSDLTLTEDQNARTLTIQVGASGADRIVLQNFDSTNANGSLVVQTFAFADGSTTDLADLFGVPTNHAPTVAQPLADQTVPEDAPFTIQVPANTFADQDGGEALIYNASLANGAALPTWLNFDGATRTFTASPDDAQVGALDLKITAIDSGNLSASDLFTLTVQNVNEAPTVANPLTDQTTREDEPFSFVPPANTFADEDLMTGDLLTYSATRADGTSLPSWSSFNPATRTLSGTPSNADVGMLNVAVHVVDLTGLRVTDTFALTVLNVNDAPTVATPLADQTVLEDAPLTIQVPADTFGDADAIHGDTLTYSATLANGSPLPSWLNLNVTTRTFTGMPDDAQIGGLDLRVTATDTGNLSASDVFTLTVSNVNEAPVVANPLADQSVPAGQKFTFTVPAATFRDVDPSDTLVYRATLANGNALPAWLSVDQVTRTFSGTPGSVDVGTLTLTVTATDTGNLSAADDFTLTVSSADQILTGTVGNDVLIGGIGNDQLLGLAGNDTLAGEAGNDFLDGGAGADNMRGGTGNDTYIVENTADVVMENANEGADTVQSSIAYTLGANLENLTLTGTAQINGTGNALDNILIGNSGNNSLSGGAGNDRLDGGLGNDTMVGGDGDDTYVVNQAGDVVTESLNQGIDTVESSISYTLGSNVENLILMGIASVNGTGSSANNVLMGNGGANQLDAGSGNDTLDAGAGNDTLLGGSGDDALLGGLGNDNLDGGSGNDVLDGGDGLDTLDGGSGDDILRGGAGNDQLRGGSGADQFTGGTGNDTLIGASGNDRYNFSRGDGQDMVVDSDPFQGNQDHLLFRTSINPLDLVLTRQANDLRLSVHGSSDSITIQNWYTSPATNQIEDIQAGNGQHLVNTQVDQLIQAMAGFSQQSGLTWDQAIDQRPQQVQAVLAANWH